MAQKHFNILSNEEAIKRAEKSGQQVVVTHDSLEKFRQAKTPLKIQFIIPPMSLEQRYGKFKDMGTLYPPLGLASIAAIAELKGHNVKVTDCEALEYTIDDIKREVTEFQPDFVGMPTFATNIDICHTLAQMIKEINPEAKIMLGGAHTSLFVKHALEPNYVDFGIQSEAEIVFDDFLNAIDENTELSQVKGLAYKDKNGQVQINPKQSLFPDLNQFPLPARHLFPMKKYHSAANLRGKRTLNIMTSRGCPYRCTYCSSPQIFGQSFRYLSTENVIKEMKELVDVYGSDSIQFYDETFTVNRKRVIELCDAIITEGLNKIKWSCFTRVNIVDEELLKKMKEAGCYLILFGVETAVPKLVDVVKKDITLEQSRKAFKMCRELGIQTWGLFILGLPGETEEDSWTTINFAIELDPDYVQFTAFMPWPGTAIYEIAKEKGVIINENLRDYTAWDKIVYKPTPDRDPEEVASTIKKAYRAYYLRPKFMVRKATDMIMHLPPNKVWKLIKSGYHTLV